MVKVIAFVAKNTGETDRTISMYEEEKTGTVTCVSAASGVNSKILVAYSIVVST